MSFLDTYSSAPLNVYGPGDEYLAQDGKVARYIRKHGSLFIFCSGKYFGCGVEVLYLLKGPSSNECMLGEIIFKKISL